MNRSMIEDITQLAAASASDPPPRAFVDPQKFSSWTNLLRVTGYVFRFMQNLKVRKRDRPPLLRLSSTELAGAREYWEKTAQTQGFPSVTETAVSRQTLRNSSISQLNVARDSRGLLRCDTRLDHSGLPPDAIRPILLPKNHHVTELIIRDAHAKVLHSGVAQTLARVRLRYWVIHGRNQVRRAV